MLMDLFHETLAIAEKRRVHFHAFMLEVHSAVAPGALKPKSGDPIPVVAAALAEDLRCLAFDEMVVNNCADAMIMSRLFRALIIDEGVTVVTTSNRPPRDLYKDGLNREHFLPFIALIESELDVLALNGPADYRLERLARDGHLAHAARRRGDRASARSVLPPDRLSARGCRACSLGRSRARRRTNPTRAQEPEGRRGVQLQAAVRRAARGCRLPRDRRRPITR